MIRIFGCALLISGICIGAGMLGLPVVTAEAGFYTTLWIVIGIWVLMTFSGLLMLEANLRLPSDMNLISMARQTLGKPGVIIAWIANLGLFYALMAAYISGGTALLVEMLNVFFPGYFSNVNTTFLFVFIFGFLVFLGTRMIDYTNRVLLIGLIGGYLLLLILLASKVDTQLLHFGSVNYLIGAPLAILVTSFGFHLLVPSLVHYMNGDVKGLRTAIVIGTTLPLIIYILWIWVVQGVLPLEGEHGLRAVMASGQPGSQIPIALFYQVGSHWVATSVGVFTFCALISSFVGVALSLFDFFSDALHLSKDRRGRFISLLLVFILPMIFSIAYPAGFIMALQYASIFAVILLVIYPVLMVWSGRYHLKLDGYRVWGGKPLLIIILLFGLLVLGVEVAMQFGVSW